MYRYDDIRELLLRHDYVPTVRKWQDGCIVKMPHPRLTHPRFPRHVAAYVLQRDKSPGVYYASTINQEERFYGVPQYAMRLYLMSAISGSCRYISVSQDLIRILDEKEQEVEELEDIIGPPTTDAERASEGFLVKIFNEARKDGFPPMFDEITFSHGVHEGYKLCKSLFKGNE